jgi:holo-[acyl-carrier protein] synthase
MLGLGNDILEIQRIREALETHGDRFIQRLFTAREQEYCSKHTDAVPHYAARFSAKEAIVKALGSGFGEDASWLDIEIINDPHGKPEVFFSDKIKSRFNNPEVLIAISHSNHHVSTVALRTK